jgi:hypothetical protein
MNTVSEEQRQRRTNNYIEPVIELPPPPLPPPIIQPPVMQPTYQPSSSYTPESSTPQNEGDKTQNILTPLGTVPNNNENIPVNDENSLTKINEYLPVKPVEPPTVMNEPPKIDPYKNLDNLLLSLLTD